MFRARSRGTGTRPLGQQVDMSFGSPSLLPLYALLLPTPNSISHKKENRKHCDNLQMKIKLDDLVCEGSHTAGRSHPSNKKMRQSTPNLALFRLKWGQVWLSHPTLLSSLDPLYSILCWATKGGGDWLSPSVSKSCRLGLWLLHL